MPIRELPDDDIREVDDLEEITLKPQSGEITPPTPFETIREIQDEENIFSLRESDFEQGRQEDHRQRAVNVLVQKLQQQYVKDMANNPEYMTLEQTQDYFKQNPAKDMAEEAKRSMILDKKKAEISNLKQAEYRNISKAPKTLRQTISEVLYRFGQDTGIVQTEEEKMAHDENVRSLAKFYDLPENVIKKNYMALTAAYRDQPKDVGDLLQVALIPPVSALLITNPVLGMGGLLAWHSLSPEDTKERLPYAMGPAVTTGIGFGLLTKPLQTAAAVGIFQGLSEVENAVVSQIKQTGYKFFAGRKASELLPEEASEGTKNTVDLLTMMAEGVATMKIMQIAPEMAQRFVKDIVNTYGITKKLYLNLDQAKGSGVHNDLGIPEEKIIDLNRTRSGKWQYAEVSAEDMALKVINKPYWDKIKGSFTMVPPKGAEIYTAAPKKPLQLPGTRKVHAEDFVGRKIVKTRTAVEPPVDVPAEAYEKAGALMPRTAEKQIKLEGIVDGIAQSMGKNVVFWGAPKSLKSTALKIFRKGEEGYIPKDSTRASMGLGSFEQYPEAIKKLKAQGFAVENTLDESLNVFGYRGVHASIDLGDGIFGELQLHTKDSWLLKEEWSDEVYREWRPYERNKTMVIPIDKRFEFRQDMKASFQRWRDLVDKESDQALRDKIAAASSTVSGLDAVTSPSVPSNALQVTPPSEVTAGLPPVSMGVKSKTLPSGNLEKSIVNSGITEASTVSISQDAGIVNKDFVEAGSRELPNKAQLLESIIPTLKAGVTGKIYAPEIAVNPSPFFLAEIRENGWAVDSKRFADPRQAYQWIKQHTGEVSQQVSGQYVDFGKKLKSMNMAGAIDAEFSGVSEERLQLYRAARRDAGIMAKLSKGLPVFVTKDIASAEGWKGVRKGSSIETFAANNLAIKRNLSSVDMFVKLKEKYGGSAAWDQKMASWDNLNTEGAAWNLLIREYPQDIVNSLEKKGYNAIEVEDNLILLPSALNLNRSVSKVSGVSEKTPKQGLYFGRDELTRSQIQKLGFDQAALGFGNFASLIYKDGKPAAAYHFSDDGLDGFAVHPTFQNTGFAQEAIKALVLTDTIAVMAPNADMLRLLRGMGTVDYNPSTQIAVLTLPQDKRSISEIKEGGSSYYAAIKQAVGDPRIVKSAAKGSVSNSPLKLKFKKQGYITFPNEEVSSPADVAIAFKELKNEAVERFYVIAMKNNKPVAVEALHIGILTQALANPFETLPILKAKEADGYYLVHNHPSGNPQPSPDDVALSLRIQNSFDKHNLRFNGHVIINDTQYGFISPDRGRAVYDGVQKDATHEVPLYTKYIEWSQNKQDLVQVKNSGDIFQIVKGMNLDVDTNCAVFYLNAGNRILGVEMLPNSVASGSDTNVSPLLKLIESIEKTAVGMRSTAVIIANGKFDEVNLGRAHNAFKETGIILLDSVDFYKAPTGMDEYTSASDKGLLSEEKAEYNKEDLPGEPTAGEPKTVETWMQEKQDLQLSLESARAGLSDTENIRTHFLHRITKFDKGWMKEEMSTLPLIYRKAKGGIKPDEALMELKNNFGIELADEQALAEFFKSLESARKDYLAQIATQEQQLKDLTDNPPGKERKFIETVRTSDKTPEEVAAQVQSFYDPITNKETLAQAQAIVDQDYAAAVERVMGPGRTDTLTNAIGLVLLNKANTEGRITDAVNIAERMAEKQTELGQAIQALSMYNRLTPEGILQLATRTVKRAQDAVPQKERLTNFDKLAKDLETPEERDALAKKLKIPHLSEEIAKQLMDMAKEIQAMPDGREKDIQTALMLQKIADLIPRNLLSKISMAQTLAQLLNPKTAIRNILGNLGFWAVENISDYVGAVLDIGASLFTKQRTVWTPQFYDQIKGGLTGGQEAFEEALMGIDLREMGRQFDLPKNGVFDSKVMKGFEKLLNIILKVPDRAFYQAAFNQSIMRQMRAAGVTEPTAEMIERAHLLGLYRTFQDDNVISSLFVNLKRTLNLRKGWGLGDMVLKYPKTPGNLLARGVEYSPFGLIKSLWILGKAALKYPFQQEDFARSTSRSIVGSALLVAVGAFLAGLGIISGKREKDKDAAALKAQAGLREYQINTSALKRFIMSGMDPESVSLRVDDTHINYDWFQPSSLGLALGANMILAGDKNIVDHTLNLGERILEAANTLEEQPLVQGLKVLMSRQDIGEGISETIKGIPASFVPTLFNQIRQLTDNTARNTKDPNYFAEMYNKVKLRIPGVSRSLPEQVTTLGKTREMYQGGSNNPFNVFLNPAFVSQYKPDPVSEMVLDIWQSTGETIHFPRVASGKIKLGDKTREPLELTPSQYIDFQKYIGRKTDVLFSILANSDKFRAAPPEAQAKKLQGYLTDIYTAGKIEVLGHRPKRVPKDVIAIIKAIGINKKEIENNELRELPDTEGIREIPDDTPIRELPDE